MIYVMTVGSVALVVLSIVGVAAAWGLARLMDRANSHALVSRSQWGEVLRCIESDPSACAVYYGARWVGICLLIGFLFSRAV
jgi:hypothetical protein